MSNIPLARAHLRNLLAASKTLSRSDRYSIAFALGYMTRVKYVRRAPGKRKPIDRKLRQQVRDLVRHTSMTQHQIATRLGLGSSGRVSEVMHGKR
jgi:hypothetical protein